MQHQRHPRDAFDTLGITDSTSFELGAHPKVIQERLGHSSITIMMDVYGHLFPSLAEALTERLDDVFREARASHVDASPAAVVALR